MEKTKVKTILIGKTGVGKTSILNRYMKDVFDQGVQHTIGVDYAEKNVANHRLQIWDLSGMERFRSIVRSYYASCHCVIFVFDLTDTKSLYQLKVWINDIKEHGVEGVVFVLVGNKSDKVDEYRVTSKEVNQFMQKYGIMEYLECSAKMGDGVGEIFDKVVQLFASKPIITSRGSIEKEEFDVVEDSRWCCWGSVMDYLRAFF